MGSPLVQPYPLHTYAGHILVCLKSREDLLCLIVISNNLFLQKAESGLLGAGNLKKYFFGIWQSSRFIFYPSKFFLLIFQVSERNSVKSIRQKSVAPAQLTALCTKFVVTAPCDGCHGIQRGVVISANCNRWKEQLRDRSGHDLGSGDVRSLAPVRHGRVEQEDSQGEADGDHKELRKNLLPIIDLGALRFFTHRILVNKDWLLVKYCNPGMEA